MAHVVGERAGAAKPSAVPRGRARPSGRPSGVPLLLRVSLALAIGSLWVFGWGAAVFRLLAGA